MAKKVLIIDDEKDMRVYLEALFRKAGYDTETATNTCNSKLQSLYSSQCKSTNSCFNCQFKPVLLKIQSIHYLSPAYQ